MQHKIKVSDITDWLKMSQDQVLDKFHSIPTAFSDGQGDKRFVYIPGTRSDRVLLVCHADTVFGDVEVNVGIMNGILFSLNRENSFKKKTKHSESLIESTGIGIGADDRAGCAMLWKYRNLGHSILITSGEEIGQISAQWLIEDEYWRNEIKQHQFAIQIDRRGYKDAVFYDVGTKKFANYIVNQTGYTPCSGGRTDICRLCKDICGVNFSTGYYNEHTPNEKLVINHWLNTYLTIKRLLTQKEIPKFEYNAQDKFTIYAYNNPNIYNNGYSNHYANRPRVPYDPYKSTHGWQSDNNGSTATLPVKAKTSESHPILCENCNERMTQQEWFENLLECNRCNRKL